MLIRFALISTLAIAGPALAQSSHARSGYVTRNGTYVAPSYATNPNSTRLDNYSSRPNVNPYTGRTGTVNPYAATPSNPYGSPSNRSRRSPY